MSTSTMKPMQGLIQPTIQGASVNLLKSCFENSVLIQNKNAMNIRTSALVSKPASYNGYMMTTAEPSSYSSDDSAVMSVPSRKRRLDHLTIEEKIKRKKLKNRVAAQTSRDRKKLRMDELEAEITQLKENNRRLALANNTLQSEKQKLMSENVELRQKMTDRTTFECSDHQSLGVGCSPLIEGPAVPNVDPLPQGRWLHPAPGLKTVQQMSAMWKILTFYILSQISWETTNKMTSRLANLKILQRAYFEKLMLLNQGGYRNRMLSLQEHVENNSIPAKWWGRHQQMWNPVQNVIRMTHL